MGKSGFTWRGMPCQWLRVSAVLLAWASRLINLLCRRLLARAHAALTIGLAQRELRRMVASKACRLFVFAALTLLALRRPQLLPPSSLCTKCWHRLLLRQSPAQLSLTSASSGHGTFVLRAADRDRLLAPPLPKRPQHAARAARAVQQLRSCLPRSTVAFAVSLSEFGIASCWLRGLFPCSCVRCDNLLENASRTLTARLSRWLCVIALPLATATALWFCPHA